MVHGSEGMRAGKLGPSPPRLLCGGKGKRKMPSLSSVIGKRAALGGMREGELALNLTNYSAWKSEPCTSPGLALVVWVQVSQPKGMRAGITSPPLCCLMRWVS